MSDEFSSQLMGTQRFGVEIPTKLSDLIVFMEERLRCGICLCSVDENPVRLPCNHIYCSTCSKDLIRHTNACPECRTKFIPRQMKGVSLLGRLSHDLTELFPKLKEFAKAPSQNVDKPKIRRNVSVLIDNRRNSKRSKPNDEIHENLISSIHSEAFRPQEASEQIGETQEQDIPIMEVEEIENLLPNDKFSSIRHSNSSKESFKKTVSFTKQAINMMEMNTDDMLDNSQVLSQLDNLINYVDKKQPHLNKNEQDIPTDELFDQLSFSPCAYIHRSLRHLELSIRHESVFSIVEYVIIPFSLQPAHEYLLECMLAIVNNCALNMYKKNKELNLKENHLFGNTMIMKSLKNKVIVHAHKNELMSYIVESQGGFVLDHYPHSKITQDYEIVQIREIADMSRFLIK